MTNPSAPPSRSHGPRRLTSPDGPTSGVSEGGGNSQSMPGGPALYTAAEAAMILRVKPSWLERQAARRRVPFTMLGHSYRFTPAHITVIVQLYEHLPAKADEAPARSRGRNTPSPQAVDAAEEVPLQPRPRKRSRRGPSGDARGVINS